MIYQTSKELFEATREAVQDAARVALALDELDASAAHVSGGLVVGAIGGGHAGNDRVGRIVVGQLRQREKLEKRLADDLALIDRACEVLYGSDQTSSGLAQIAPSWWADAIYHRYIGCQKWEKVAQLVMFHKRYVQVQVQAAFELMDENGMTATIEGQGQAED